MVQKKRAKPLKRTTASKLEDPLFLKEQIRKLSRVTKSIAEDGHLFHYHPQVASLAPESDLALLVGNFNRMISRLIEYQDTMESKVEARTKELMAMKQKSERMSPHFLYNTLNMIHSLIRSKPDVADKALLLLADNYRYLMNHANADLIPFVTEWKFLERYLELMSLRVGNEIDVRLTRPKDLPNIEIPPLTLQPLVENVFKHAFNDDFDRKKTLEVVLVCKGTNVNLKIRDNGKGLSEENPHGRTLEDIKDRLSFYYHDVMLKLSGQPNEGALLELRFDQRKVQSRIL